MKHALQLALILIVTSLTVATLAAQQNDPLIHTGSINVSGHAVPYAIRHLPVASFPQLPAPIQSILNQRQCLIPQTDQAHRPENVFHASLFRAHSDDWAVLCSTDGTISLLIFREGHYDEPTLLVSASETDRLHYTARTATYGFDWGIDAVSPQQLYDAQAGMKPRPPHADHDALRDATLDGKAIYRYYTNGTWTEAARESSF